MKSILEKCTKEDLEFISTVLDSYFSFTDDKRRKNLLALSEICSKSRSDLIELMDKQIRYYGSSDAAYLQRALFDGDGGVTAKEIVEDVCGKLKVKIKKGGSLEARLERLVNAKLEKELFSMTPEELAEAFEDIGMGKPDRDQIIEHIKKNGKASILPVLYKFLGPAKTLAIIETVVVSFCAQFGLKEAAKALMASLVQKNPWLNSLGPILWVVSSAWLTYDMQSPAYRKTIPICLYLGVVGLRDGKEDDK